MGNSSDEEINSDEEVIDLRPLWRKRPFLSDSSSEEDKPVDKSSGSPPRVIELTPLIETEEIGAPTHPFESVVSQLHDDMTTRLAQARAMRERILRDRGLGGRSTQACLSPSQHPWRFALTYLDEETLRSLDESPSSHPANPVRRPFASVASGVGRLVEAFNDDDDLDHEHDNANENPSNFILPGALDERDEHI